MKKERRKGRKKVYWREPHLVERKARHLVDCLARWMASCLVALTALSLVYTTVDRKATQMVTPKA
jgi:hypothetical protein